MCAKLFSDVVLPPPLSPRATPRRHGLDWSKVLDVARRSHRLVVLPYPGQLILQRPQVVGGRRSLGDGIPCPGPLLGWRRRSIRVRCTFSWQIVPAVSTSVQSRYFARFPRVTAEISFVGRPCVWHGTRQVLNSAVATAVFRGSMRPV